VVVRTASDAYEFAVGSDGDIVKAITQGTPVITPLPGEENGQAISYSADGTQFLTLSSVAKPVLRSYKPFVPPPPTVAQEKAGSAGGGSSQQFPGGKFQARLPDPLALLLEPSPHEHVQPRGAQCLREVDDPRFPADQQRPGAGWPGAYKTSPPRGSFT